MVAGAGEVRWVLRLEGKREERRLLFDGIVIEGWSTGRAIEVRIQIDADETTKKTADQAEKGTQWLYMPSHFVRLYFCTMFWVGMQSDAARGWVCWRSGAIDDQEPYHKPISENSNPLANTKPCFWGENTALYAALVDFKTSGVSLL